MAEAFSTTGRPAYVCQTRTEYLFPGTAEVRLRACGHCRACLAAAKRDRAARSIAQALSSQELVVLTLTYRPGEPGAERFIAEDRSKAVERLRRQLWRDTVKRFGWRERGLSVDQKAQVSAAMPRFVYFGVGETGGRSTRRKHWHLVLFFDKASGLEPSARSKKGRLLADLRSWWPHGLVTVDVKPQGRLSDWIKSCRYVAKYLEKSRGVSARERRAGIQPEAVFFASNRKPLGVEWICEDARRYARAGLPYSGGYSLPGVDVQRRRRVSDDALIAAGKVPPSARIATRNFLLGRCRDHAIEAYKAEWRALYGDRLIPATEFLQRFDKDYCGAEYRHRRPLPFQWSPRGERPAALPAAHDPARAGLIMVDVRGKGNVGVIQVWPSGSARFFPKEGEASGWLPAGDLQRFFPMLDQLGREAIERKLAEKRGPGWMPPLELKAAVLARALARDDAVRRWAKPGVKVTADHLPGMEPDTAVRRKLRINGDGHVRRVASAIWRGASLPLKVPIERRAV